MVGKQFYPLFCWGDHHVCSWGTLDWPLRSTIHIVLWLIQLIPPVRVANCQTHNYHLPIVSWSNPVGYGSEFPRMFWFQMRNTTSLLASHHLENSALVHNQSRNVYLTICLHICLYIYILYIYIYIYIHTYICIYVSIHVYVCIHIVYTFIYMYIYVYITGVSHFEKKKTLVHRFLQNPIRFSPGFGDGSQQPNLHPVDLAPGALRHAPRQDGEGALLQFQQQRAAGRQPWGPPEKSGKTTGFGGTEVTWWTWDWAKKTEGSHLVIFKTHCYQLSRWKWVHNFISHKNKWCL